MSIPVIKGPWIAIAPEIDDRNGKKYNYVVADGFESEVQVKAYLHKHHRYQYRIKLVVPFNIEQFYIDNKNKLASEEEIGMFITSIHNMVDTKH